MHTILVKIENKEIKRVQYFDSKWERELGETVNYDGVPMQVGIIADTKSAAIEAANSIIKEQNQLVRAENKIKRRKAKIEENKFWNSVIDRSPVIKDCFETLAYCAKNNIK